MPYLAGFAITWLAVVNLTLLDLRQVRYGRPT